VKNIINKPIVLIGMMGTGKSTIGRKLAHKLNLKFYDSDRVIEEREGLSVVDIFDFRGEDYFRQKEQDVIAEIINYGPVVLSTGGSSFTQDNVRNLIKEKAISVWLAADLETLYPRIARRNTRPELNCDNKKEVLAQLIAEHTPYYEQADIKIDSNDEAAHIITDLIIMKLKGITGAH
jgi:shikimate kinase